MGVLIGIVILSMIFGNLVKDAGKFWGIVLFIVTLPISVPIFIFKIRKDIRRSAEAKVNEQQKEQMIKHAYEKEYGEGTYQTNPELELSRFEKKALDKKKYKEEILAKKAERKAKRNAYIKSLAKKGAVKTFDLSKKAFNASVDYIKEQQSK